MRIRKYTQPECVMPVTDRQRAAVMEALEARRELHVEDVVDIAGVNIETAHALMDSIKSAGLAERNGYGPIYAIVPPKRPLTEAEELSIKANKSAIQSKFWTIACAILTALGVLVTVALWLLTKIQQ